MQAPTLAITLKLCSHFLDYVCFECPHCYVIPSTHTSEGSDYACGCTPKGIFHVQHMWNWGDLSLCMQTIHHTERVKWRNALDGVSQCCVTVYIALMHYSERKPVTRYKGHDRHVYINIVMQYIIWDGACQCCMTVHDALQWVWPEPTRFAQCLVVGFSMIIIRWLECMMTSSNGNIYRVTGPLCEEFTGHWWIPLTEVSDAGIWYFLWSATE